MSLTQEIGKLGENAAKEYLIENGYNILESNWRTGNLEVDLIVENKFCVAFVEVKTRAINYVVSPTQAVTLAKQKNIIKAANIYIRQKHIDKEVSLDVISVITKGDQIVEIEHIPNAYYPQVRTVR